MSRKALRLYILVLVDLIFYYIVYRGIGLLSEQYSATYIPLLFTWVINIAIITVWLNILVKKDYNAYDTSWLALMVIAPLWGFILYLSIARDFTASRRFKKRPQLVDEGYVLFEPESNLSDVPKKYRQLFAYTTATTKHAVFSGDSSSKIISNGQEYFDDILEKMNNATRFIFVNFYIFKSDNIGNKIISMLCQKAEEGLDVRLLYDFFGGQQFHDAEVKKLRKSGVKIYAIDPFVTPVLNTRVNYRSHRKMVIIDGKYGYTGGMNVGDEYIHGTKKYMWRDSNIRVTGSIVTSFTSLYARDYYYVTNELISGEDYYLSDKNISNGVMQLLQSGPDTEPLIRNTYIKLFNTATRSIKVATPYLAVESDLLLALRLAAKSGVKVDVMIPGVPDKKAVYRVTESFVDDLMRQGVNVHKLNGTFLHSKVIIVDDEIACCGTYNLDVRSAMINFENTVLIYNESVNQLVKDFAQDMKKCTTLDLKTWEKRGFFVSVFTELFKIFTPIT